MTPDQILLDKWVDIGLQYEYMWQEEIYHFFSRKEKVSVFISVVEGIEPH